MLMVRLPIFLFCGALYKRVEYLSVLATLTIGQQKFLNCVFKFDVFLQVFEDKRKL